jgi:hypothetical protein
MYLLNQPLFTAQRRRNSNYFHEFFLLDCFNLTLRKIQCGAYATLALLIAHLIICSNPTLHKIFSPAVRELSVSFKQGDGNGKTTKMSMVWPRKMPGLQDGCLARIAGWLLPVQGENYQDLRR